MPTFGQSLIHIARKLYLDDEFGVELSHTVYALDSTTVDLCLSVFPWARFRKTMGAIKLHTLLDLRGNIPTFINISDGLLHDVDAVFTDPPYFGNVQYAELMDFCYVWLRKLVGHNSDAFNVDSTRTPGELTGNVNMGRGIDHFTEGLSSVFQRMARALKPGSPLAFTYHHNHIEAYYPVAVAILDAGLTCSASLPCPAEMGASIHISGTGSSIIDTVFVCRQTGVMRRKWLANSPDEVARIVKEDLDQLRAGNVKPTLGDIRCVTYGHVVRLAIWSLRIGWKKNEPTTTRIEKVTDWLQRFGGWAEVEMFLEHDRASITKDIPLFAVHENTAEYGAEYADVSF